MGCPAEHCLCRLHRNIGLLHTCRREKRTRLGGENGIVRAGRSPDKIETCQALVAKACDLVGLSEWRYAANGKPGDVADVPRIGAFQGFADQCRCLGGVELAAAASRPVQMVG